MKSGRILTGLKDWSDGLLPAPLYAVGWVHYTAVAVEQEKNNCPFRGGLGLHYRLQRLNFSIFSEKKENAFAVLSGREPVRLGVRSVKSMLSVSMSHR